MEGHAKKCTERYCELANKKTEQLYKVSTPCLDDHYFKEEDWRIFKVCSQMVLTCLYLARIGGLDILWSVNKLARGVTKWTRACHRRLARLISCIYHANEFRQYCHVGNTAQHCRLCSYFKTQTLLAILKTQNLPLGKFCVFSEVELLYPCPVSRPTVTLLWPARMSRTLKKT